MFNHIGRSALIAFALAGHATLASAVTVRVYHVEPLPFLPGGRYLLPVAINANGDIAGSGIAADGMIHAFRWSATGGLEDLGTYGVSSMAWGMNDNGDVVGTFWTNDSHPFIAPRGGGLIDLTTRYPQIQQINDISNDGRMTGFTWQWHAFRTQPDGTLQELTSNFSFGARINSSGEVAGVIWRDSAMTEPRHAFRYTDGEGLVDLGTLNGGWSGATAINSSAVVAGWSGAGADNNLPSRAFRVKPGEAMQDLGVLPYGFMGGAPAAYAINDAGDVVGGTDGWISWTPFLYTDAEGMIDLTFHITTADRLTVSIASAHGINNSGQIVAFGYIGSVPGTARLTPFQREFGGPVASPIVNVPVLSPSNNQMVMVSVDPHVTDEFDPEPICRITQVVNSEGPASGPDPDVSIAAFLSVQLRATRLGTGPGRTYTLKLSCSDKLGVTSVTDVVVTVPHDNGQP